MKIKCPLKNCNGVIDSHYPNHLYTHRGDEYVLVVEAFNTLLIKIHETKEYWENAENNAPHPMYVLETQILKYLSE